MYLFLQTRVVINAAIASVTAVALSVFLQVPRLCPLLITFNRRRDCIARLSCPRPDFRKKVQHRRARPNHRDGADDVFPQITLLYQRRAAALMARMMARHFPLQGVLKVPVETELPVGVDPDAGVEGTVVTQALVRRLGEVEERG